jgi:hypothetical protein
MLWSVTDGFGYINSRWRPVDSSCDALIFLYLRMLSACADGLRFSPIRERQAGGAIQLKPED